MLNNILATPEGSSQDCHALYLAVSGVHIDWLLALIFCYSADKTSFYKMQLFARQTELFAQETQLVARETQLVAQQTQLNTWQMQLVSRQTQLVSH